MSQNYLTRSLWAVVVLFTAPNYPRPGLFNVREITGEHEGMVGEVDLTGPPRTSSTSTRSSPTKSLRSSATTRTQPKSSFRRMLQQSLCIWPHCNFDGRFGSLSVVVLRQLRTIGLEQERIWATVNRSLSSMKTLSSSGFPICFSLLF